MIVMYDIKEMKHSVWIIRRERRQNELTYEKAVAMSHSYNDDNLKQSIVFKLMLFIFTCFVQFSRDHLVKLHSVVFFLFWFFVSVVSLFEKEKQIRSEFFVECIFKEEQKSQCAQETFFVFDEQKVSFFNSLNMFDCLVLFYLLCLCFVVT
jgi:hypothetical protein